jgi:HEAT repeat protein
MAFPATGSFCTMKKKLIYLAVAVISGTIIFVVGYLIVFYWHIKSGEPKQNPQVQTTHKQTQTVDLANRKAKWDNLPDSQKIEGYKALNSLFNTLAERSDKLPSASKFLQNAIDTGDKVTILQAFTDIYSRTWKMSEVVPALNGFLNHPDPYVRLNAAHDLFIVGDQSGYNALLALVKTKDPIPGLEGGREVRIEAASILAQFDQTDAVEAIYNLYQQTKSGDLIVALQKLIPDQVGALIPPKNYYNEPLAIRDYGIENDRQFLPQITSTFHNTPRSDVKAAAAWALATMTSDENAINYLVQTAQTYLSDPSQSGSTNERDIIKYLGSIQTPAAKQTLEAALNSSDPSVVQTAIVNLIYNQGGSDKAVQVIANQLNDSTHAMLPWDFTMNMATQLINNPEIQAAGQVFSKTDATGEWQLYTVERKNWSPNNWMGGYILKPKN